MLESFSACLSCFPYSEAFASILECFASMLECEFTFFVDLCYLCWIFVCPSWSCLPVVMFARLCWSCFAYAGVVSLMLKISTCARVCFAYASRGPLQMCKGLPVVWGRFAQHANTVLSKSKLKKWMWYTWKAKSKNGNTAEKWNPKIAIQLKSEIQKYGKFKTMI